MERPQAYEQDLEMSTYFLPGVTDPFSIRHLIFDICHRQKSDQPMPNKQRAISGAMTDDRYQMTNEKCPSLPHRAPLIHAQ
jgi:hypothetical protein